MMQRLLACVLLAAGCGGEARTSAAAPATPEPSTVDRRVAPSAGSPRTVLLELYTSQGCSSCPPADALVAQLAEDPNLDIVALAFHVDYWDDLGWPDPYASPTWTARQRAFAAATGTRRVYTPQLLVDGQDPRVGRSRTGVRRAIEAAATRAPSVRLALSSTVVGDTIDVKVEATPATGSAELHADLWVALYEDGIATDVKRGENAGRRLQHEGVVRQLHRACSLAPPADAQTCAAKLQLDRIETGQGGIAVFAQSASGPEIYGVTATPLSNISTTSSM